MMKKCKKNLNVSEAQFSVFFCSVPINKQPFRFDASVIFNRCACLLVQAESFFFFFHFLTQIIILQSKPRSENHENSWKNFHQTYMESLLLLFEFTSVSLRKWF